MPAPDDDNGGGGLGKAAIALSIPTMLASGPLVGALLGYLIQRATGWGQWVMPVMILLGAAAGISEAIRLMRRIS